MASVQSGKGNAKFSRTPFTRQFSVPVVTQTVCPICFIDASKKKTFYCETCALKKASPSAGASVEQLIESLRAVRMRKAHIMESINSVIASRDSDVKRKLEKLRSDVHKLRTEAARLKSGNKDKHKRLVNLRSLVKENRSNEQKHGEKFARASDNVRSLELKLIESVSHMSRGKSELVAAQWRVMLDLFFNVVPLDRIESAPFVEASAIGTFKQEADTDNIVALQLAEAQRWAYLNGRWVEANPTIVTPTSGYKVLTALLPADGSCSSYIPFAVESVGQGVSAATSDATFSSQGPGGLLSKDLVVGFSYLNQLTASLASIFHLFLPFPLSVFHKDVLCGRLSVEQFRMYAARVSANVCFLCIVIGLDSNNLRPFNPAYNLWLLREFIISYSESHTKPLPLSVFRSPFLDGEAELQRILDSPNADALLANVITPLCASITDPSYFECMADDEEWVTLPGGVENYSEPNAHVDGTRVNTSSFMASTNPLLPSTITSALFSFIRGRSSSQS